MSASLCDWLDDYIDNCLTSGQREQFKRHLATCERCQSEMTLQNRLDLELRNYAQRLSASELATKCSVSVVTVKGSGHRIWVLAASVALVALAIGLHLRYSKGGSVHLTQGSARMAPHAPSMAIESSQPFDRFEMSTKLSKSQDVHIRNVSTSTHLAVVDSISDELTLVMLYPTIDLQTQEPLQ
ncbi:MAG: zf-HC2 domain-containing protein [Planctomycetales bacterium]|nr:zf-HC2 domain-containing protein [Planctomycetales bacterium]